jgi:hypothetical protein
MQKNLLFSIRKNETKRKRNLDDGRQDVDAIRLDPHFHVKGMAVLEGKVVEPELSEEPDPTRTGIL